MAQPPSEYEGCARDGSRERRFEGWQHCVSQAYDRLRDETAQNSRGARSQHGEGSLGSVRESSGRAA